jgi:hypothetical protein
MQRRALGALCAVIALSLGLVAVWAAFLAVAPGMAFFMWRRFRRTAAERAN